jgi:hypothetical protein
VYAYPSNGLGLFGGNSIVGGYVYRGVDPEVQGRYFFGDSFPTRIWTFDPADPDGTVANVQSILDPTNQIVTPVSFAEDGTGDLYIVALGGKIFRIETDAVATSVPVMGTYSRIAIPVLLMALSLLWLRPNRLRLRDRD